MDLCFYLIHELAQILQYLYLFLWIPTVGVSEAQTGILDDEMGSTLDTNYAYDIWHKTMFNVQWMMRVEQFSDGCCYLQLFIM